MIAKFIKQKSDSRTHGSKGLWQILAFAGVAIGLMLIAFTSYVWMNRYSLLEDQIRQTLAGRGFTVDLSIDKISTTEAILKDVTFGIKGQKPFFKTQSATLNYEWREALKGNVNRVELSQPSIVAAINESGEIVSPLFPTSKSEAPLILPKDGIIIHDGHLDLNTPYGVVSADVDGTFLDTKHWNGVVQLEPTRLQDSDISVNGHGELDLSQDGDVIRVGADLDLTSLTYGGARFDDVKINATLLPFVQDDNMALSGPATINIARLHSDMVDIEDVSIAWDGDMSGPRGALRQGTIQGDWRGGAESIIVSKGANQLRLAETLSLNGPISKAPVAQNFAPQLTRLVHGFLRGSQLNGAGTFQADPEGYRVSLTDSVILKRLSHPHVLTLMSDDDAPLLVFNAPDQNLDARFSATVVGDIRLNLFDMTARISSDNGVRINAVESLAGRVLTPNTWRATTDGGEPARLAPFAANVKFNRTDEQSQLRLHAAIDYDGDLPGGYAKGLNGVGVVNVTASPGRVVTTFISDQNTPVRVARFDTPTGWRGENIKVDVSGSPVKFTMRDSTVGLLRADVTDMSGQLIDTAETRHLDISVKALNASGTLAGADQNWRLKTEDAIVLSDNLPEGGSETRAQNADITLRRRGDDPVEFTLETPSANVTTQTVNAESMTLSVAGTPEDFTLKFSEGRAKFSAESIPILPLKGSVNYDGEKWVGTATTSLPKTQQTPIDVAFEFKDGYGVADVVIDDLAFTPGGFQPQSLVSAFTGKVSQVDGRVSAQIKLAFGPDQPLQSSGTAKIKDMSLGTLPGPFSGINTDLTFSSIFPLQTEGRQVMTVDSFDPGFPLLDGRIEFELIPDGIKLYDARWPLGVGFISLDPTTWVYAAPENRVTLRVENVSLGAFLASMGNEDIKATGDVEGELPVIVEGVKTRVENGIIRATEGGVIEYRSKSTDAAAEANDYSKMAFDALKDFHYKSLEMRMNGPLDGNMVIKAAFDGSNEKVLNGAVFAWDVTLEGELLNIARSFGDISAQELIQKSLGEETPPN